MIHVKLETPFFRFPIKTEFFQRIMMGAILVLWITGNKCFHGQLSTAVYFSAKMTVNTIDN